jgi:hypothetical protein
MTIDMPRIFFSYARADAEFVLKLANDLRSAGINLWIDQLDIPPGDRWDSAVESALVASPCLLVVLSPASVVSQNVMDEVAFALGSNKKVVPVLHRRCDIPFRIQRLQYIDFTTTYHDGFTQLLKALNVVQPSQTAQATAQTVRPGEATSGVTRIKPGISTKRLIYPLIAGLLAAVIGISYWIYASRPTGGGETKPVETRQGKFSDELSTVQWGLQILHIAEADVYVERYYQKRSIIRPKGPNDILIIIDARLKNLLQETQSPLLTERVPGNTGLIDIQGHSYQPLDYDARQEQGKFGSYAGAALLPGAVADFALIFSVPKGTKPKALVFTLSSYPNMRNGMDVQISLEK